MHVVQVRTHHHPRQFKLTEDFLTPYRKKGDPFQSLLARSTYLTKYCREGETWTDTIRRTVEGNMSLVSNGDQKEAALLFHLFWTGQALPPGRSLWVGGVEGIPADARFNCWYVTLRSIDDWCWTANQLMLGGGVGVGLGEISCLPGVADTPSRLAIWCRSDHENVAEVGPNDKTFLNGQTQVFAVPDSREGWVEALRYVLRAAFEGTDLILDVSDVRPRGRPIRIFGGTACGPGPLTHLLRNAWSIVHKARGRRLTSVECLDVTNHIGLCIKSGNVRRCFPGDTLVHTEKGLIPIRDVRVGDKVLTSGLKSDRYMPVTAHMNQGTQRLVEVETQMGPFRCTENHRVAVLTGVNTYDFRMASDLEPGDRLVFVDHDLPGEVTHLPSWSYDPPEGSTTCVDISFPELTTEVAWFLGYLLGDGYVRANHKENGFNAEVSLAVANDGDADVILDRLETVLARFGVNNSRTEPSEEDDCWKVRATSKQLAWYLHEHFKQPKTTLKVPECILRGTPKIRAAFVAGVLDADGGRHNKPVLLCGSVYPSFLEELQAVYASIGIPTRFKMNRPEQGTWQALYHLNLVGTEAVSQFKEKVQSFAFRQIRVSKVSQNDYGYPSEDVRRVFTAKDWGRDWCPSNKQMVTHLFKKLGGETKGLVPIMVSDVHETEELSDTYDIEVGGAEEFVAAGLLVHNSALIALGDATDHDFRDAKKDWEAVKSHRHTSNNSIAFRTWEEISSFDWQSLVADMTEYGEPGILNLPLVWRTDPSAEGVNPCFAAGTLIAVADGRNAVPIEQLAAEGCDVPVYSMDRATGKVEIKMGRHPRVTGHRQKLVRVWLDDGSYLDTTPDHGFLLLDGTKVKARNLQRGNSLPRFTKPLERVRKGSKDYYRVYCNTRHPFEDKLFEHRLIARFFYPEEWGRVYSECKENGFAKTGGLVVHHKDYDQLNNTPENLQIMSFKAHCRLHGQKDNSGEKNGRWSGVPNERIRECGLELTRQLGRRFSLNDWDAYALRHGLPRQFSNYRTAELGTPLDLARWCATKLGLEHPDMDPRVVRTLTSMLEQGYEARIIHGGVVVKKICETCGEPFEVPHGFRERSFCSELCGSAYINSNEAVHAKRVGGMDSYYGPRQATVMDKQARVCSQLQFDLGRNPNRKEWSLACKVEGVAFRIGPTLKHGFRHFHEVLDAGSNYNHKVVRVEELPGEHTVYNITVDDFHTVAVITRNVSKRGNKWYTGVYVAQCGEQALHNREACNLAEVFPANFEPGTDSSLPFKLVTRYTLRQRLTPLSDTLSQDVGLRNMRIGVSLGGICDFEWSNHQLATWYTACRGTADNYADELGVAHPITTTTVKPSGCRPWYALTSTTKGLLTLEELFEGHPDGDEWSELQEPIYALQEGSPSRITKTYDNGMAEVFRIRMSCDLEVESTPNHQWRVLGHHDHVMKEEPCWVRADRIRVGDVLDIRLGVYSNGSPAPLQSLNRLSLRMRGDATPIRQPEVLNPDLAWFFGYLWGDGAQSPGKYRIRFTDQHEDNLRKAQRVLHEQFGVSSEIHPASEGRRASVLEVGSKMLWHWLIKNDVYKYFAGGLDIIPRVVRASGREEIIAFVAGLLDADGGAYGDPGKIRYTIVTADDSFARHLQSVCWAVGLGIGRSHNSKGECFQEKRDLWLLTSNHFQTEDALSVLCCHSVKCAKVPKDSWYYRNQKGARRVMGKVEAIESLGEMPTFDVEVESSHWYYAGCVKSHNTISLLNGSSPGIHAPHAPFYLRRVRIAKNDRMVPAMVDAGVPFEYDIYDKTSNTLVFAFPMKAIHTKVTVQSQSLRDQFERQAAVQENWADNAVSSTLSFSDDEKDELADCLKEFVPRLKSTSCLARAHGYAQAPYEEIDETSYKALYAAIQHDHPLVVGGEMDDGGECAGGSCPLR